MKILPFYLLLWLLTACHKDKAITSVAVKDPYFKVAKSFLDRQPDSAFYYFNRVAIAASDSLQTALAYHYMGRIQSESGDYFGSQESLTLSLRYLDSTNEKHRKCLAADYNELGLTSVRLSNFDAAIYYFDHVTTFRNEDAKLTLLNNKALAYQSKGDRHAALRIYNKIIGQSPLPETYARILTNRAAANWELNKNYPAAAPLLQALHIRLREKDRWGQNSSYAHLSDYYRQLQPDSALFYAQKMYGISRDLNSPDDELLALEKLIALEKPTAVKHYFQRYRALNDSLQIARNAAKNQFALIRYEVEKSKSDNLQLRYQVVQRNIQLVAGLAGFMLLAGGALIWYRKRSRRQDEEKRWAVLETQQQAAKQVHDTLSNDIYRIMKKVQHEPGLDKAWLLDHIDDVYQRSRDISYELIQQDDERFAEELGTRLKSFSTEQIKVILVGNEQAFWQNVDAACRIELKYVLQELMVNMQKHSEADHVVIKFEARPDHYLITYADNGIGLSSDTPYGNGLTNTGNRIKAIRGQVTFDSGAGEGLTIQITFPAI